MSNLLKKVKQGLSFPKNYIEGRTKEAKKSINDLKPNEGAIVEIEGKKIAAFKKSSKETILLSPICTHLGCVVGWNNKDASWDCPCHGSRFSKEGQVIKGPAKKDLASV